MIGGLQWSNPDPRDSRYWLEAIKALQSRRIPFDSLDYAYAELAARPKSPYSFDRLARAISAAIYYTTWSELGLGVYPISRNTSTRWLNEDGSYLTQRQVRTVADVMETFGAVSSVSNHEEFLKRVYAVMPLYRREVAGFQVIGSWTKTGADFTDGTTLAGALAFLDSLSQIEADSTTAASYDNFGSYIDVVWRGGTHFNVLGYSTPYEVRFFPHIASPCTLSLTTTTYNGSGVYDPFDSAFAEGLNVIPITAPNQIILANSVTYRLPYSAGDTTVDHVYGFSASGTVDYGTDFVLPQFGA